MAYNPVFSLSTTTGDAKDIEAVVVIPVNPPVPSSPSFTPETVVTPTTDKVFKSWLISETLVNVTSLLPPTWYWTIESVFIPVNAFPGDTIVPIERPLATPVAVIIESLLDDNDDILVVSNNVSALKSIKPV